GAKIAEARRPFMAVRLSVFLDACQIASSATAETLGPGLSKSRTVLFLTLDIGREIGRFVACQVHVRHARVRRQEKIGKCRLIEVRLAGDGRARTRACRSPES